MHDAGSFTVRAHIPGTVTLTGDMLAALWFRLVEEGIADSLFYDGGVRGVGDFTDFMAASSVYCYAVYDGEAPLALTWLNNFAGRTAMMHFAVFKAGLGMKSVLGRYVVQFLLHGKDAEGGYCLDSLYGLTPQSYVHVLRFIRRLGFRQLGVLPGAVCLCCHENAAGARHVGGVISVCTRESLNLQVAG